MPQRSYLTVAAELQQVADAVGDYFEQLGYRLKVEQMKVGYPYTPALVCTRQRTSLIVVVGKRLRSGAIGEWSAYAKSCRADVRIVIAIPADATQSPGIENVIHDQKAGLLVVGKGSVMERFPQSTFL